MKPLFFAVIFLFLCSLTSVEAILVANWTLTSTTDSGPNGYTLQNNGATFTDVGARFDGNDYFNRSYIPYISVNANFTTVHTFKGNVSTSIGHQICNTNGTNDRFCITIASGYIAAGMYNGSAYVRRNSLDSSYIQDTNWHCVAYAHNTSATNPDFIVDGIIARGTSTPTTGGGTPRFTIGIRDDFGATNYTGEISSILVYNETLSPERIEKLCSDMRVEDVRVDVTSTPLANVAPYFGTNTKFFGRELSYVDVDGDQVVETRSNTTWHRNMILWGNYSIVRVDMRLDRSTGVNTFVTSNTSNFNINAMADFQEWAYNHSITVVYIIDYMPSWLANTTLAKCDTALPPSTQYCLPTNYTTFGNLTYNFVQNVTRGNTAMLPYIRFEMWNEPYQNLLKNDTLANRVDGYLTLYNNTYVFLKARYPTVQICPSTVYNDTAGLGFAQGVWGNLSRYQYDNCTDFHDYGAQQLYVEGMSNIFLVNQYHLNISEFHWTEINTDDSNCQVNYTICGHKYFALSLMQTLMYGRNVTEIIVYQHSDQTKYAYGKPAFESFSYDYRLVSEPQLDNFTSRQFYTLSKISYFNGHGKTNYNATANKSSVMAVASSFNNTAMSVTVLNLNTGKNLKLNFTNTSYTLLTDMSTGTLYNITNGQVNVSIAADNVTVFLAEISQPQLSVTSPTNTTYYTREINISYSVSYSRDPVDTYYFTNGTNTFKLNPYADTSGYNIDLNASASAVYSPETKSFDFFGISGNAMAQRQSSVTFDMRNMTFSLWVYPNSSTQISRNRPVAGGTFTNSTALNQWYLNREAAASSWSVSMSQLNGTSTTCSVGSITAINVDEWNHVIARRNDTMLMVYVNGVNVANDTTCASDFYLKSAPIYVGGGGLTSERFNGSVSDVRVWNRTLNDTEITNVYANQTILGDLVAWYQFAPNGTGRYLAQEGSNTWTVYANDTSGNVGSQAVSFNVNLCSEDTTTSYFMNSTGVFILGQTGCPATRASAAIKYTCTAGGCV